jgi:hypothetical protein
MLVAMSKPLFAWDCLEDSPSLGTIKAVLASLPDGHLLDGLRQARGRGRNDYPVHVLLHLIVDVKHEVALAWQITTATASDAQTLPTTLTQAKANLPPQRMKTLAFDKAADDHETHKLLARSGIRPLIETHHLWKEEAERMLPGHDGNSNIVYDETETSPAPDASTASSAR